jgi:hypothetical protein
MIESKPKMAIALGLLISCGSFAMALPEGWKITEFASPPDGEYPTAISAAAKLAKAAGSSSASGGKKVGELNIEDVTRSAMKNKGDASRGEKLYVDASRTGQSSFSR